MRTDVYKYDADMKHANDNDSPLTEIERKIGGSRDGEIFVLNEDIRIDIPENEGKVTLVNSENERSVQPLAIRSGVGDCVRIILTSKLKDTRNAVTGKISKLSKVNIHTHFVQFDPQASDGVITGFSYEQSVRPYNTEKARQDEEVKNPNNRDKRVLVENTAEKSKEIVVNQAYRLRKGIWIGIGLGEGMCDDAGNCGPHIANDMKVRPHTEIRKIMNCRTNGPDDPFCRPDDPLTDQPRVTLQLNKPLDFRHKRDEAVGVEFVQYSWYSDVDTASSL